MYGRKHTFSIALLVRAPLDPSLPLLPLRIDTIVRDAVFDTAKARTSVVALLASLLAVCACVLDLTTLGTDERRLLGWTEGMREWVDVHGHL